MVSIPDGTPQVSMSSPGCSMLCFIVQKVLKPLPMFHALYRYALLSMLCFMVSRLMLTLPLLKQIDRQSILFSSQMIQDGCILYTAIEVLLQNMADPYNASFGRSHIFGWPENYWCIRPRLLFCTSIRTRTQHKVTTFATSQRKLTSVYHTGTFTHINIYI